MALFVMAYVAGGFLLVGYEVLPFESAMLPGFGALLGVGMMTRGGTGIGTWIFAGVLGLIAAVVAIVAWNPQVEAIDEYAFIFVNHCEAANEKLLRVFTGSGSDGSGVLDYSNRGTVTIPAGLTGNCTITAPSAVTAATATKWYAGSGALIGSGATVPTAVFKAPLDITKQYAGISMLIIGVMPILNTAAFLGVTGSNLFMMVRGVGGVQVVIIGTIAALVLSIVGMNFGPTIVGQMDGIHNSVESMRFHSLSMFGTIIELIVEFFPTVFTVGLLALVSLLGGGVTGYMYMRGRGRMSGGGGMM